jgi:AraC-like DNA-binding protein
LIVPLFIGTAFYQRSLRSAETEFSVEILESLSRTSLIVDRSLIEIERLAVKLGINATVNTFLEIEQPFTDQDYRRLWEITNNMPFVHSTNDLIRSYAVFSSHNSSLISPGGFYDFSSYQSLYERYFKFESWSYSEWKTQIEKDYSHGEYLGSSYSYDDAAVNEKRMTILYLRSLPLWSSKDPKGTVILFVEKKALDSLFSSLFSFKDSAACIVDKGGNIITSINASYDNFTTLSFNSFESEGIVNTTLNGNKVMLISIKSSYNRWKYYAILPYRIILDRVSYIKRTVWSVILIFFISGILIASLISYRKSRLFIELVSDSKKIVERGWNIRVDEVNLIKNVFEKLIGANIRMKQILKSQKPFLLEAMIDRLLKGHTNGFKEIKALEGKIGIGDIRDKNFTVLVINILGHHFDLTEDSLFDLSHARNIIQEIIQNIFGSAVLLHNVNHDKIAVLVSFNGNSISGIEFREVMEKIFRKVHEVLLFDYNIKISMAGGSVQKNIGDVWKAFYESLEALKYKHITQDDVFTWFEDIRKASNDFYYPIEIEVQLMNCIKAGDGEKARMLLGQIYTENMDNRNLSTGMLNKLLEELNNTLVKIRGQLAVGDPESFTQIGNRIISLDSYEAAQESYNAMTSIYISICNIVDKQKRSHNKKLIEKAAEYIDSSYMQWDLSLTRIGDKFGLNEVYLSLLFKEQKGINFSAYLENLRMRNAIELLGNESLSINDIAGKVGYNSSQAFRRAFKRVNGVNPTSYRKLNLSFNP